MMYEHWERYTPNAGQCPEHDYRAVYQLFTVTSTHDLRRVSLRVWRTRGEAALINVSIHATEAIGSYLYPLQTSLCSQSYDASDVTEDYTRGEWIEVVYDSAITLTPGVYAIVMTTESGIVSTIIPIWWMQYLTHAWDCGGMALADWTPLGPWGVTCCYRIWDTVSESASYPQLTMADLQHELNLNEVWNDIRVILPSYETTLELLEDGWHKYPVDIVARATDGVSICKYGRRTKIQNKQVLDKSWAESYCEGEVERMREPIGTAQIKTIGKDSKNIINALSLKLSDLVGYSYAPLGATAVIDSIELDVDSDRVPRLSLRVTDIRPLQAVDWFNVDVDKIDNSTDFIG